MKPWFNLNRVTNAASDGKRRAELLIYDLIGGDWFGDGTTAKDFVQQLQALGELDELNVRINSPGGSVMDAEAIYNALVRNSAKVIVDIDGMAVSSAGWVAMAGDEVNIAEGGLMMMHLSMIMMMGNKNDLTKEASVLDKLDSNIANIYAKRTGRRADTFLNLMAAETWFNAQEALDHKLVDSITPNKKAVVNCFGPQCAQNFRAVPDAAKAWFDVKPAAPCGCKSGEGSPIDEPSNAVSIRLRQLDLDDHEAANLRAAS